MRSFASFRLIFAWLANRFRDGLEAFVEEKLRRFELPPD
jgi:hypothetical protein